jgi:hypothetical protein
LKASNVSWITAGIAVVATGRVEQAALVVDARVP